MLITLTTDKFLSQKEWRKNGRPNWTLVAYGLTGRCWSMELPRSAKTGLRFELDISEEALAHIKYFGMEAGPTPPTGVRAKLYPPYPAVDLKQVRVYRDRLPLRVQAPDIYLGPKQAELETEQVAVLKKPEEKPVENIYTAKTMELVRPRADLVAIEKLGTPPPTTESQETPQMKEEPAEKQGQVTPQAATPAPQPQAEVGQQVRLAAKPVKPKPEPVQVPAQEEEADAGHQDFVFPHELHKRSRKRGRDEVPVSIYYRHDKKTPTLTLKLSHQVLAQCRWKDKQRVRVGINPYSGEMMVQGVRFEEGGYLLQFQKFSATVTFAVHEELGIVPFETVEEVELLQAGPLGALLRMPAHTMLVLASQQQGETE